MRKILRLAHHQLRDTAGWGAADVFPPSGHGVTQHVGAAACELGEGFVPGGKQVRDVFSNDLFEEIFFALEVQKQSALRHTRASRHLFGFGSRKPFFNKQSQGSVEQLTGASLFATLTFLVRIGGDGGEFGRHSNLLMTDGLLM